MSPWFGGCQRKAGIFLMLAITQRHESLISLNCQLCLAASVRVSTEHLGLRSRAWAHVGRDMLASAVLTINPKNLSFSSGKRADPAHPLRSAEGCAPITLLCGPHLKYHPSLSPLCMRRELQRVSGQQGNLPPGSDAGYVHPTEPELLPTHPTVRR